MCVCVIMSQFFPVELDWDIFHQKPYWKEFRFDLTQIPTGESVTAAEFRIYKMQSFSWHVNKTLHVSIYEIVQEHSNRYSKSKPTSDPEHTTVKPWGLITLFDITVPLEQE